MSWFGGSLCAILVTVVGARYNQRLFTDTDAINFVDATKHGFRVVFHDHFIQSTLAPTLLPTVYITAIPMKENERAVTKVVYPDAIFADKQVTVSDLTPKSWYVLCIEWESFSRANESTGAECRLKRTLDAGGRGADSFLNNVEAGDLQAHAISFRIRSHADFPARVTVFLKSVDAPAPSAQVFIVEQPTDIEGTFMSLRPDRNYGLSTGKSYERHGIGQLCVVEEPLQTGYTAMGRHVGGMTIKKCYLGDLVTKSYELSNDSDPSAFAISSSSPRASLSLFAFLILLSLVSRL